MYNTSLCPAVVQGVQQGAKNVACQPTPAMPLRLLTHKAITAQRPTIGEPFTRPPGRRRTETEPLRACSLGSAPSLTAFNFVDATK